MYLRITSRCNMDCDHCVCDFFIFEPNGDIKFCGCDEAPIVGNVWTGINEKYEEIRYEHECWNDYMNSEKEEVA